MFPNNFQIIYFSSLLVMLSISTLQRPSFDPRPIHVEFVVDMVAKGQVFL
jgi:hypothetical protein